MKLSNLFKKLIVPGCIAKDVVSGSENYSFCKVTKIIKKIHQTECWGYWYNSLEDVKNDKKFEEREMYCKLDSMERVI